jgi:hypothetical protein
LIIAHFREFRLGSQPLDAKSVFGETTAMDQNKSFPKKQHYVPQFLLRNFASTGKEQLYVYDKKEGRCFRAKVQKIAAENGLYDLQSPDGKTSVEPMLSKLEGDASAVIQKLIKSQNVKSLSSDEKVVISLFTGIQMLRVTAMVDTIFDLTETIRKKWGTLSGMPENEIEARKQARQSLVNNLSLAKNFAPQFLNKTWLLLKAHEKSEFYISDNPVVMHNIRRTPLHGNLGLAVTGIEIYLPLSPKLTLAFFCKSKEQSLLISKTQYDLLKKLNVAIPGNLSSSKQTFFEIIHCLETGEPIQISEQVICFQNELQIWHSSRFLFSKSGEFDLVKDAVKRDPSLKRGPQWTGG